MPPEKIENMESQVVEYKESWRDEYLKWICGFANAQGGSLYIGINDKGEVVGVGDAKPVTQKSECSTKRPTFFIWMKFTVL